MYKTIQIVSRTTLLSRSIHSSAVARKTLTESVKETAQDVNLKVGKTLAGGIEKGQQMTEAVKETVGAKADRAKEHAEEVTHEAKQKANQTASGAKEAKDDVKQDMSKHWK